MPDLEALGIIMGRRSFPKWWLESIRPVLAPPATNNQQQGKHRAIAPKPSALPAPINMHTNCKSAPTNPSIVLKAPTEGFSNMVKSSPTNSGNKFAARKEGTVDIRSYLSGTSGNNRQISPDYPNIPVSICQISHLSPDYPEGVNYPQTTEKR